MIQEIVKDQFFLSIPCLDAKREDFQIAKDLQDTLDHHRNHCVGLAANMIGYQKRVIIVTHHPKDIIMFNPIITKVNLPYQAKEGCLSLCGEKVTTRYQEIEVTYQDIQFRIQKRKYKGHTAQIIQHEIDHCNGILI